MPFYGHLFSVHWTVSISFLGFFFFFFCCCYCLTWSSRNPGDVHPLCEHCDLLIQMLLHCYLSLLAKTFFCHSQRLPHCYSCYHLEHCEYLADFSLAEQPWVGCNWPVGDQPGFASCWAITGKKEKTSYLSPKLCVWSQGLVFPG